MPARSPVAAPPEPRTLTDLEQLQGVWATIAGRFEARLLVAGERFAFELATGDVYLGRFALDPDASPRRMDMRVEEGPAKYTGQVAFCIYHLESGVLRWCPTRPGSGTRLTAFPRVEDDRYLSLVFRHVRGRRG